MAVLPEFMASLSKKYKNFLALVVYLSFIFVRTLHVWINFSLVNQPGVNLLVRPAKKN